MLMLFASLLAIPLALNILASAHDFGRFVDPILASVMLCLIWAFVTVLAQIYPFPDSKKFHSLIDLIGLSLSVTAYMTRRQRWTLVLAFLFLGQLVAHAWFWGNYTGAFAAWWSGYQGVEGVQLGRTYIGALNLLWFAQLLCVGWSGGAYVASRALGHLRRRRRLPDLARR